MEENNTKPNNKNIKVLRTYTSDMAEAVRNNEMSVIKIAMAEKEKREREDLYKKAEGSKLSKILFILGGIVLIIVAVLGSLFLIQKKKELEIVKPVTMNIETFISYESQSLIDTTNISDASNLLSTIKREQQDDSSLVKALFLTKKTDIDSTLITTKEFFSLIKSSVPNSLTRSISDKFLLGKYLDPKRINNKSDIFLVLQTSDYPLAYASMLEWEEVMLRDLFVLFDIDITEPNSFLFKKEWNDIIVNNKDTRVLYGENDEGIIYYTFVDKNNFVISNDLNALKEVISRIIIKNPKPL
jgi:hypothetical protein